MWRVKEAFGVMVVVLSLIWGGVEASPFVQAQSKPLHHDTQHVQVDHPHSSGLERRDEDPCASHPCPVNGSSYKCGCIPGYTGKHCEHECPMARRFSDFRSNLYKTSIENTQNTQNSNLDEICSVLVDELRVTIEGAVQNELNCHCDMLTFAEAAELFSNKKKWTFEKCIQALNTLLYGDMPGGGSPTCTNQDILDCANLVQQVSNTVRISNTLTPEIQNLIDEATACKTKMQHILWPFDCMDEGSMFFDPANVSKALWTMQAKGCNFSSMDNALIQDTCMMSATEYQEFKDCVFATALQQEECADLVEYQNIFSEAIDDRRAAMCPDQQLVEGIWNRTGCTNSPLWHSEPVSEPTQDVEETVSEPSHGIDEYKNVLRKVAHGLTDIVTLIRTVLDEPTPP